MDLVSRQVFQSPINSGGDTKYLWFIIMGAFQFHAVKAFRLIDLNLNEMR